MAETKQEALVRNLENEFIRIQRELQYFGEAVDRVRDAGPGEDFSSLLNAEVIPAIKDLAPSPLTIARWAISARAADQEREAAK